MSEEASTEKPAKKSGGPSGPMILLIVNFLAMGAFVGVLVVTKILYKRPKITESAERQKIEEQGVAKSPNEGQPGEIKFDEMTLNIIPALSKAKGGTGQQHFVQVILVLEIADLGKKDLIDKSRAIILDGVIDLFGKKTYEDLTTVQGRYLVRSQILDLVNELVGENLATNVYFGQFLVQ